MAYTDSPLSSFSLDLEVQALPFGGMPGFRISFKLSSMKLLSVDVISVMTADTIIMPNGIICVNVVHIRKSQIT